MEFKAIISIDYDDTIVYQDFPRSGTIKPNAKEVINRFTTLNEENKPGMRTCKLKGTKLL